MNLRNVLLISSLFLVIISCTKNQGKAENNEVIGDTITTKSGLKYVYLKKGDGRKIEKNSKIRIYTELFVNDADTTIWSTATDKDSVFSFIHRKSPLVKGFTEQFDYLVEGDEIISIIPDSLAYGKRGRGIVPPSATLIYKPIVVKYVSKPKETLKDTLISITKSKNIETAYGFYEDELKKEEASNYHTDLQDLMEVFSEFMNDKLFAEVEYFSKNILPKAKDNTNMQQNFSAFLMSSLESQKKFKEAITVVEPLANEELNKQYWQSMLKRLQSNLKK